MMAKLLMGGWPVAAALALCGCARPGVEIGARADVNVTQPVPVTLDRDKPFPIAGPVSFHQPVEVTINGLAVEYAGTFISEPLFNMVNRNDSGEYVAAVWGEPDFKADLSDGTTIWRWHYRPKSRQGAIFAVFGDKNQGGENVTTLLFLKDGVVQNKWRG